VKGYRRNKNKAGEERAVAIMGREAYDLALEKKAEEMLAEIVSPPVWRKVGEDGTALEVCDNFGAVYEPVVENGFTYLACDFVIDEMPSDQPMTRMIKTVPVCVRDDWKLDFAIRFARGRVAAAMNARTITGKMLNKITPVVVVMWLRLHGRLFWDSRDKLASSSMYFEISKGRLMLIHSDIFRTWLAAHVGVEFWPSGNKNPILDWIDVAALNPEVSSGTVPGMLFDRRGEVLYISCGDSKMVRVDKHGAEMVANGTDDVVFMSGQTLREWKLLPADQANDPFEVTRLFSDANYAAEHGRMVVRLWFLALPSCQKSYPALVFTGRWRSGKSRMASGLFEILGLEPTLGVINDKAEDDFWNIVNACGIACFDNVDTKVKWFGDAMQLACTNGSRTKRTLYENTGTTTLRAKGRIILTSNNAMFASESGLSDRLQICRLEPFVAKGGKTASDKALSVDIEHFRDAAMSWLAWTDSRALSDRGEVAENVNMRHPDFADFAMRAARAIGQYDAAVLALKSAEFDKAMFTVQNDQLANMVFGVLKARKGIWSGTSSEMDAAIRLMYNIDDSDRRVSRVAVGKVLNKYIDQLLTIFDGEKPKDVRHVMQYTFKGLSAAMMTVRDDDDDRQPLIGGGGDSEGEVDLGPV